MQHKVLFDIRDPSYAVDAERLTAAQGWLGKVTGTFNAAVSATRTGAK